MGHYDFGITRGDCNIKILKSSFKSREHNQKKGRGAYFIVQAIFSSISDPDMMRR